MMERILAWTGDRAGELGRPELEGAGQVSQWSASGGHCDIVTMSGEQPGHTDVCPVPAGDDGGGGLEEGGTH